jgi:hypothetical protein
LGMISLTNQNLQQSDIIVRPLWFSQNECVQSTERAILGECHWLPS